MQNDCEAAIPCWSDSQGEIFDRDATNCIQNKCSSCYTGTEPSCASEEACLQSDSCSATVGMFMHPFIETEKTSEERH